MKDLEGKRIVVGMSGSVAIRKAMSLVEKIVDMGADVKIVMTGSASGMVELWEMEGLVGNNSVFTSKEKAGSSMEHIELGRWGDLILICPGTANIIGKIAGGIGDDLLSTLCLASTVPLVVVPAMNKWMWENPFVKRNVKILKENGVEIWGPTIGEQACGDIGFGRMIEVDEILDRIIDFFGEKELLKGKRLMITAGPTREYWDSVRYITNGSSGKMGYGIAEAAFKLGAEVILISGPTNLSVSEKIKRVDVVTSEEMLNAVKENLTDIDIFIGVAAVSDYRPVKQMDGKMKKAGGSVTLELEETADIISSVKKLSPETFVVGFAAEVENLENYAMGKLKNKGMDMIVANVVGKGIGMEVDENEVVIYTKEGEIRRLGLANKEELAKEIVKEVAKRINLIQIHI